jgi:hydroxymethylbilane synthase
MSDPVLRLATRGSPMAMAQSRQVAEAVTRLTGRPLELVGITSAGDVSSGQLTQIGGTGVFVSALRSALLAGEVDLAVHSMKDLPTGQAQGIALAAVPVRDDPRDALAAQAGAKLADLPCGARIGTGSPRRAAQLLMLRADLRPVPVRGNAGTRLAKVESGELDAVVLGYAGLARIGRLDAVTQVFEPDEMLPAAGQGALAVECGANREDLVALLGCVDDACSRAATTAERSMLGALQAGCAAPVGAYAAGTDVLWLRGAVVAAGGEMALRGSASGPLERAEAIGRQVAGDLRSRGAGRYMAVSDPGSPAGDDDGVARPDVAPCFRDATSRPPGPYIRGERS